MEAQVLEQQHLAGFKLARHFAGDFANAIRGEAHVFCGAHVLVDQLAQPVDNGAQRVFRIRFSLGAAEVRGEDDLGVVAQGVLDGGQRGDDARVVGDFLAVFRERHVKVDANENALVLKFDVANGELGHDVFLENSCQ